MNAGFIVGYVFLFLLVVGGGIYIYSYWIYTKNVMFNEVKHNVLALVMYVLLCVLLIVAGALYLTILKDRELPKWKVHAGLSFALSAVYLVYFILNIVIVKKYGKNKLDYKSLTQTDYKLMFEEYRVKLGDIELVKFDLKKHHKRYFEKIMKEYEALLAKAKDLSVPTASKIADVVVFDDAFTHKWSNKANKFHKYLVLQYLTII